MTNAPDMTVPWSIRLTAMYDDSYRYSVIVRSFGIGNCTIDWGDGTVEEHLPLKSDEEEGPKFYTPWPGWAIHWHPYERLIPYDIRITGEAGSVLQKFNCSGADEKASTYYYTALELEGCEALEELECYDNRFSKLDVSGCPALKQLDCGQTRISTLDISRNTRLEKLGCYGNGLTALDVSRNTRLEWLSCEFNRLTELDVSACGRLELLYCQGNRLTTLDLGRNPGLKRLCCCDQSLTVLDVSECSVLQDLDCARANLTELDVSRCPELETIRCDRHVAVTVGNGNPKIIHSN